jgi:hypothetical protein
LGPAFAKGGAKLVEHWQAVFRIGIMGEIHASQQVVGDAIDGHGAGQLPGQSPPRAVGDHQDLTVSAPIEAALFLRPGTGTIDRQ